MSPVNNGSEGQLDVSSRASNRVFTLCGVVTPIPRFRARAFGRSRVSKGDTTSIAHGCECWIKDKLANGNNVRTKPIYNQKQKDARS